MPKHTPSGFTLTELVIVLAIVGILLAIAIPSYQQYVLRSRRAEALEALLALEQRQQRYYLFHNAFSAQTASLGLSTATATGLYSLAINSASAGGYLATATASGTQQSDTGCTVLTIRVDSVASGSTLAPTGCWNR